MQMGRVRNATEVVGLDRMDGMREMTTMVHAEAVTTSSTRKCIQETAMAGTPRAAKTWARPE